MESVSASPATFVLVVEMASALASEQVEMAAGSGSGRNCLSTVPVLLLLDYHTVEAALVLQQASGLMSGKSGSAGKYLYLLAKVVNHNLCIAS